MARRRVQLLPFTVGATILLWIFSAALFVLGIFNETLRWDIFGPRLEAILYGVFGSTVALAAVGVAMTLVLGVRDVVRSFRALERSTAERETGPSAAEGQRGYGRLMLGLLLGLGLVVAVLALTNRRIQVHRNGVFQRLAAEQMDHFGAKLAAVLPESPRSSLSRDFKDLIATLERLNFVQRVGLFLPDQEDESVIWSMESNHSFGRQVWRFERHFVAREAERAMQAAFAGDPGPLEASNQQSRFDWYFPMAGEDGGLRAVLRIRGNKWENFREYPLGA